MKITKLDVNKRPKCWDEVKYKESGRMAEILAMTNINHEAPIIRLDRDHYAVTSEIKEFGVDIWDLMIGRYPDLVYEFKHDSKTRADDIAEVRKTMRKMRDIINSNAMDIMKLRWVTLTYAENMTDTDRLYKDYQRFVQRLRYDIGHFEYIAICEPQGRGAWHLHVIMIFDDKAPYIANSVPSKPKEGVYDKSLSWEENFKALVADERCKAPLFKAWRNGWVKINKMTSVDNIGAYVSAYLTDMELSEVMKLEPDDMNKVLAGNVGAIEKDVNGKTKRFVKGARLCLYPKQFNMFRTSRGVKRPIVEYMTEADAQKLVDERNLTGETTIEMEFEFVDEDGFRHTGVRTINRRYYNANRKRDDISEDKN